MNTPDLTRRGYDAELRRHRENLARALDGVRRGAETVSNRLHSGDDEMSGDARRLLADASDVAQFAAALEAASQLSFMLGEES